MPYRSFSTGGCCSSVCLHSNKVLSTLDRYQKSHLGGFLSAIGSFLGILLGSFVIGVGVALMTSLLLKNTDIHRYPSIESCIVALLAYSTYLLSNASGLSGTCFCEGMLCSLSGIVSLLFCGMAMKHYMYNNLSLQSQRTTRYMFHVVSAVCWIFESLFSPTTLFKRLSPMTPTNDSH